MLHRLSARDTVASVDFRLARSDDAEELGALFEQFFGEAHYRDRGIHYDRDKSIGWLIRVISNGFVPHVIAVKDGAIVGALAYEMEEYFCRDPICIMHTLYVVPGLRRSAIGRLLVAFAVDLAVGEGACAFHASVASGMPETASLKNMFARIGFEEIGYIMGKGLKE